MNSNSTDLFQMEMYQAKFDSPFFMLLIIFNKEKNTNKYLFHIFSNKYFVHIFSVFYKLKKKVCVI